MAKKRYKNYQEYLESDEWTNLKEEYKKVFNSCSCNVCGMPDDLHDEVFNYHHFRYPKDWNNDSIDNLLYVCKKCHDWIHDHEAIEHGSNDTNLREYLQLVISLHYIESFSENDFAYELYHLSECFLEFDLIFRNTIPYAILVDGKMIAHRELSQAVYRRQKARLASGGNSE